MTDREKTELREGFWAFAQLLLILGAFSGAVLCCFCGKYGGAAGFLLLTGAVWFVIKKF